MNVPKGVAIAVFGTSLKAIGISQYPFWRSNLEKIVDPVILDVKLAMLVNGYLSGMVTLFRWW